MARFKIILTYGFFAFVFAFTLFISISKYKPQHYKIAVWDTEGYYIYLPAVFIYHGFEGIPSQTIIPETQQPYLPKWPGTQKVYTKYTCGEALLILPFWLAGHCLAHLMPARYTPDGFSEIYMLLFLIAIASYLTGGLYISWRILRSYFSDMIVLLALLCIWMGTSFIQYTSFNPGNSHVFSYFLIALIVYQTPGLYAALSVRRIIFFALTFALLALVRPTNGIVLIYPMFYSVWSWSDMRQRFLYLMKYIRFLPLFIAIVLLVFIPQFVYWKFIT
ncbi:MAG: hypothetical protein JST76_01525, partial [Bacteroidetes bacterium]|nr:hypothetical protein [Bacteroidota bacterium]